MYVNVGTYTYMNNFLHKDTHVTLWSACAPLLPVVPAARIPPPVALPARAAAPGPAPLAHADEADALGGCGVRGVYRVPLQQPRKVLLEVLVLRAPDGLGWGGGGGCVVRGLVFFFFFF